jgi:hypothetical protein
MGFLWWFCLFFWGLCSEKNAIGNIAVVSSRTSDPDTVIYLIFIQVISVTAFSTLSWAWHPSAEPLDNQNDVFSPKVRLWATINSPLSNTHIFSRLCTGRAGCLSITAVRNPICNQVTDLWNAPNPFSFGIEDNQRFCSWISRFKILPIRVLRHYDFWRGSRGCNKVSLKIS